MKNIALAWANFIVKNHSPLRIGIIALGGLALGIQGFIEYGTSSELTKLQMGILGVLLFLFAFNIYAFTEKIKVLENEPSESNK